MRLQQLLSFSETMLFFSIPTSTFAKQIMTPTRSSRSWSATHHWKVHLHCLCCQWSAYIHGESSCPSKTFFAISSTNHQPSDRCGSWWLVGFYEWWRVGNVCKKQKPCMLLQSESGAMPTAVVSMPRHDPSQHCPPASTPNWRRPRLVASW